MRKTVVVAGFLFGLGMPCALAQPSSMSAGPVGTPITPPQIGNWCFVNSISRSEAVEDARSRGFQAVRGLHEDSYGDWFGTSTRGGFIVFPDGRTFPL